MDRVTLPLFGGRLTVLEDPDEGIVMLTMQPDGDATSWSTWATLADWRVWVDALTAEKV